MLAEAASPIPIADETPMGAELRGAAPQRLEAPLYSI